MYKVCWIVTNEDKIIVKKLIIKVFMVKIANNIARQHGYDALATGMWN
jgi:adenylyl- and sulfurtransferase ThiI